MPARALLRAFETYGDRTALIYQDRPTSYADLRRETEAWAEELGSRGDTRPGSVLSLVGDYAPSSLALLLAMIENRNIVAPLTEAFARQKDEFYRIAEVTTEVTVRDDGVTFATVGHTLSHPILQDLANRNTAGLVLFSSGSTGKSKAVVHDSERLLAKYHNPRRPKVTIPFMLFDHIGGLNTVLHVLSSGGTAVIAPDRSPETICRLVEQHRVQVLPTSPTFVHLLLMSEHHKYDLSSLEILAYGAERMPASSLERLNAVLPQVKLIQNYGLSEVGILSTKSESSDSLWVKVGGDIETRVRDGLLEIKAKSAMLGYLNETSPFTEDGWLKTGDRVEVKGEYLRILGRESDLIIIGGEKVYPAEIEDLLGSMEGVVEVVVRGEPNAITGAVIKADVRVTTNETRTEFRARMLRFFEGKLPSHKVPQRLNVTQEPLHNARFKKVRT